MKTCTACGQTKKFSEFARYVDKRPKLTRRRFSAEHRKTADGYRGQCRACRRKLPNRQAPSREAERRRIKAKAGKIYTPRAELQAKADTRLAEQQKNRFDRAFYREMRFWWHPRTPNTLIFRIRYRSDPEFRTKQIARTWARKERHLNMPSDGTLTPDVLAALFASARVCPYCDRPMRSRDKTMDHVIPRVQGGLHSIHNALICCRSCNSRKGGRSIEEWRDEGRSGFGSFHGLYTGDAQARSTPRASNSHLDVSFSLAGVAASGRNARLP